MKGRAFEKASCGKPSALQGAVGKEGLHRVVGAGGIEAASAGWTEEDRQERRGGPLIDPDQGNSRGGGKAGARIWKGNRAHGERGPGEEPIRAQASENACSSLANGQRLTVDRATTRRSHEAGSWSWWCRNVSRILRFARLRFTAAPTAWVDATKQALRKPFVPSPGVHQMVNAPQSTRDPFSRTARISPCRRRCCAGRRRMDPEFPNSDNRQPLTTFASTGSEHPPAAAGGHAGSKADLSGSFFAVRTEGWLHGFSEIKSRLKCLRERGLSRGE